MVYYNVSGYNIYMFLADMLSWWYSKGLLRQVQISIDRLRYTADYFSLRTLISTLFSPYKQVSAGRAGETIDDRFRAFFDRLISRFVGAFVRIFMIVAGLTILALQISLRFFVIILWITAPFLPVASLIFVAIGWMPS
jgi:hypothetical protein